MGLFFKQTKKKEVERPDYWNGTVKGSTELLPSESIISQVKNKSLKALKIVLKTCNRENFIQENLLNFNKNSVCDI